MAKEGKKFNKKLALTVAIPALIMVVIIGVVGVSFAWFSDSVSADIATINLTTADVFMMEFVVDGTAQAIYSGQTAFDSNGLLVTDVHGAEKALQGAALTSYLNDVAFVAPFNLRMDTEGHDISFDCKITNVNIAKAESTLAPIVLPGNNNTPDNTTDDLTESDIKLGFTWYIKGEDNDYYTPYGTRNGLVRTQSSTEVPTFDIAKGSWDITVPVLNSDFNTSFAGDSGHNFTFNIVFAPEILYWQQYGPVDVYNQTAEQIYGDANVDGGFRSAKWNSINKYSSQIYSGSTYRFTVMLSVKSAEEVGE